MSTAPAAVDLPAAARPDPTDAELVTAVQAGDTEAFGTLYDRHHTLVYRYVYWRLTLTRGARGQLAQDLTQETFLRAIKSIGGFTPRAGTGQVIGWLLTIARNIVVDHYKKGSTRNEVLGGPRAGHYAYDAEVLGATVASVDDPAADAENYLIGRQIYAAMRQLTPDQHEILVHRFLLGLSVPETAAALGRNDGQVKALQYRGTQTLRRILTAQGLSW